MAIKFGIFYVIEITMQLADKLCDIKNSVKHLMNSEKHGTDYISSNVIEMNLRPNFNTTKTG
jgi:hypothetical protein